MTLSRIGLVQTNSTADWDHNLNYAFQQIEQAAKMSLDLVAFPEMFLVIDENRDKKFEVAEPLDGPLVNSFQKKAKQHKISILMGSIYESIAEDPGHLYNTSVLIDATGAITGVYRKIHLCDIDSPALTNVESNTIRAGDQVVTADNAIGKIGMSICYDLRFPSLFQSLRAQGAQIIFVPSAFFLHTGKHHWIPLLQARAIENQVYIAAPAQWGRHRPDDRTSYGHSLVIDPWGSIITCASEKPGLVTAQLDLGYLEQIRQNMPVFEHRRPDCY